MSRDYAEMEKKWQSKWAEKKLNESERQDGKPKFMLIFAYPGLTGYLHVGHLRGYTYADALGRYKRMTGYNVLFPVGTHATGNGAISLASKIARKDEKTVDYLLRNGCPEEEIDKLKEPMDVVNFFNNVYQNDYWKRFGFLADWRRFTCTLYPDYGKFIEWQFTKLKEKGLLVQKPYYAPFCPVHGPVAVDPSETDISKGGLAETQEYTLLKFWCEERKFFLVAATLRPETIFGQVCFWARPDMEYSIVEKDGERWVVSPQCAEKMSLQFDGVEEVGRIAGKDLIGLTCTAPMIHKQIPVFPADFVDPDVGTGLVTSCPSDAPDDWNSLQVAKANPELTEKYGIPKDIVDAVVPVSIISIKGYGDFPAQSIIEKMKIPSVKDPAKFRELMDEAKKQVYKDGYHMGVMKDVCGEFSGMRVEEAKDKIQQAMLASKEAEIFRDLTEEVVCRCGQRVHIKRIDDQWFINYADRQLTDSTKEHCRDMTIFPAQYYENVQGVLDWYRERACVRLGNWLGTRFPFDNKWIIEAISDSTLYPLFYTISLYSNTKQITPEQMTPEFFDYVVLEKGEPSAVAGSTGIDQELLEKIRKDVHYWYPLDINLGGKEHMTVHFPVFLMNHRAILPDDMQPKGIIVNWYVTGKNKDKISKSKGGAQPIPGAVAKFGADSMRLYYAHVASMFVDVEWDEDLVFTYKQKLENIMSSVEDLINAEADVPSGDIDAWLLSRFNTHVSEIRAAMDRYDLRQMATVVYYDMSNDMRWYARRGGKNRDTVMQALRIWINAMMPITPHVAEELWSEAGFEGLVSEAQFPEADDSKRNAAAEYGEGLVQEVIGDVNEIKKMAKTEVSKAVIYTTPMWKVGVMKDAIAMAEAGNLTIPDLTKRCMADENLKKRGKETSDFVKKIAVDLMRSNLKDKKALADLDEEALLKSAKDFIASETGMETEIYGADEENKFDPSNKARVAVPGRPAIYLC
ncbi:leucine--tRNA ligase [Methanomethylophilus alvi]|uniref:leucine--tRNA ligase n=1 Tax=Methanomethylophilus alvi TaxID=1291540 RepID=UPI00033A647A|nr:leucine--tRNA ligase [Methanomethylophilus alvi]MDD7479854.1 leucine--tRNA ligase [Methanomethylophilus alvi]MDY7061225.1 leucine--tRNA ligase [Methanomethylophilus alvi]CDF30830.1 leucine--tRNA ligase [Methanoculleus sp. CAG:1088]